MGSPAVVRPATAHTAARRGAGGALVLGGVALILGALMPWVQVTVPIAGTITRTGVDSGGDAVFCIVVGAVVCLVGLRSLLLGGASAGSATERALAGTMGILGLVCAVLGLLAAKHVDDRVGSALDHLPGFVRSLVSGEIGAGIWVVAAGGLVVALAGLAQVVASAPAR
jgi:hypothetical protein